MRALIGLEQASERRKRQRCLTTSQPLHDDKNAEPEIMMAIVLERPRRSLAKGEDCITLGVASTSSRPFSARRVKQAPLLDRDDKDQPIHQPQQLGVVVLRCQLASVQGLANRMIIGVQQEAGT